MLALTDSEYGFIGEIRFSDQGSPFLKTFAISNIAWDEATKAFYEQNAPKGMEFHNLATLFGAPMASGEPVIANDPGSDPRRGGLPAGHPALDAFLGCPVWHNGQLVAMFGLANRPGGYDHALLEFLDPLVATIGLPLIELGRQGIPDDPHICTLCISERAVKRIRPAARVAGEAGYSSRDVQFVTTWS